MNTIGLDIGTTSLCGVCVDAATGEVRKTVTRPNTAALQSTQPWEKTQDVRALLACVREIFDELAAGGAACVGVTGQMHGIVYLNATGDPVSPLYTWQDGRGDRPFRDGKTYAQYASDVTGRPLATGYGAVTHFYNTVNGLVPPDAVCFCTVHDLCVMALTGRKSPLTHPSDAASFGLFDAENDRFDDEAIHALGLTRDFFPAVAQGEIAAGATAAGVPVSVAVGDNQAGVLGSLADLPHSLLVNVGTGSQLSCVVPRYIRQDGLDCRPLAEGRYLLAGSALCGGRAYAILEAFFRQVVREIGGTEIDSAYPAMDKLMETALPDDPLTVTTTFAGTRAEPGKRGAVENVGIANLTPAALCDGVLGGMVRELLGYRDTMAPFFAAPPTKLVGSGNGLRRNAALRSRVAREFGLPLKIPVNREEAAFGAALYGTVCAGLYASLDDTRRLIHYEETEG